MIVVGRRLSNSLILCVPGLLLASVRCAPSQGKTTIDTHVSASGGARNASVDGSSTASPDPTGGGGQTIEAPPETRDPTGTTDASCVEVSVTAEQVIVKKTVPVKVKVTTRTPVALYLMQDRSGSMDELSPSKWSQAVGALNAFSVDPASDGLDVALDFFPKSNAQCNGTGYDTPVVPLGRLLNAPQARSISDALTSNAPGSGGGGGTPLEGGLRGAINYCLVFQAQNPGEQCVAVLITDGAPSGCTEDHAALAQIAADAHGRTPPVLTFAIGMDGADFDLLNQIAIYGGTDCSPGTAGNEACNIAANSGTSFTDALNLIRQTVTKIETHYETTEQVQTTKLACEYSIPPPPDGKTLDRTRVNVRFTSDAGKDDVFQVASLSDCSNTNAYAWYFDDSRSPTKILVCPDTCKVLQQSSGDGGLAPIDAGYAAPRVDVLLGCQSHVAPPA